MNLDFSKFEVLVIGDVMLDHYILGTIKRQSPEAEVPIVSQTKSNTFPGGAANVALNILGLGAKVNLIGVIGDDYEGKQLRSAIEDAGIKNATLIQDKDRITTRKTRVLADGNHIVRVDQEDIYDLSSSLVSEVLQELTQYLENKNIDIVILQDYNKGLFTQYLIKNILALLKKAKVPYVVDPKNKNIFEYQHAQILKPNKNELINAFGLPSEDWKDLAKRLFDRCQPKLLLVTLGAAGVWSYDGQEEHYRPAHKIADPDVCGAGDAVISIAALAECKKYEKTEILKLCNEAGAVTCQSLGVKAVTLNDLMSLRASLHADIKSG